MSTSDIAATPLIDHHCHGVAPQAPDLTQFQAMMSESYRPPPPGTSEFQKPLGLAIRRHCAPLLDLEPYVSGERYVERRAELGATEVNRRMLSGANVSTLLIDTGFRSDSILSYGEMGTLAERPAYEILRIEAVTEAVAKTGVSADAYSNAFRDELLRRSKTALGLKTIVAYRCTFKIDQTPPSEREIAEAAGRWLKEIDQSGRCRLSDPTLARLGLWAGGEICRDRQMPMQVHVGFGDPDVYMHACDPTHFTDFIAAMEKWEVPIMLLHNYPFVREAAWLSEIFQNVYLDTGAIQHWAGASCERVVADSLEMSKFTKLLYSSDAIGLSEFYYLSALLFRRSLANILNRWIKDDMCSATDADEIVHLIASANAQRIYRLDIAAESQRRRA